jgi:hypothetical protein
MVLGGLVVVVAIVGMVAGSGPAEPVAAPTSTSTVMTTTTPAPTASTSTTAATTTSTMTVVETTTSTTVDPLTAIAAFVPEFAMMIAAGDAQGLFDTLHPAVLETQDPDLCKAFIEREILALVDYRLTGGVTGPVPTTFGSTTVDVYSGPVSFSYQGQTFDSTATFAMVDSGVRWFTTCR